MQNEFTVQDGIVMMMVRAEHVIFDLDDLPKLERFAQWKLSRSVSIVADYRNMGKMLRITLHNLLTGSRFVKWLNGDRYDFRKANMIPIEKAYCPRPHGVKLKGNEHRIENGIVVLTINNKGVEYEVLVDVDDYPVISQYTWNRNPTIGYIQANERLGRSVRKHVYIHRLIMGVSGFHTQVDHINGNKLDNRRSNLRLCTQSQNNHNTEKHRLGKVGVCRDRNRNSWVAQLHVEHVRYLKTFKNFDDAVAQYRRWVKKFNPSGLGEPYADD